MRPLSEQIRECRVYGPILVFCGGTMFLCLIAVGISGKSNPALIAGSLWAISFCVACLIFSAVQSGRSLASLASRLEINEFRERELSTVQIEASLSSFDLESELAKAEKELSTATRDHEHAMQEARGAWRGKSGPEMLALTIFGEGQEGLMRHWTHSHALEIAKWQARRDFLSSRFTQDD